MFFFTSNPEVDNPETLEKNIFILDMKLKFEYFL